MKFSIATVIAVAALTQTASAHLWMSKPAMFAQHKQAEGFVLNPLLPDGSDFPCQGGIPDETIPSGNSYNPGDEGVLEIKGSAVHSGGSGQMVVSYKFPPSSDPNDWHVMTSWQGNHPIAVDGNLPEGDNDSIPLWKFKVPANLPKGKAIFAWNWFNKSGNREHYMKCATVSIGGSTEQNPGADVSFLPTMFRANSQGETCIVPEGTNGIKFKNPGPDVQGTGEVTIDCDASRPGSGGSGTPAENGPANPPPSNSAPPSAPAPPTKPAPPTQPAPPASPAPPSGGCSEGSIICNSDGTWGMCSGGQQINMGPLAAGTVCRDGSIQASKVRRDVRFSHAHRRRSYH